MKDGIRQAEVTDMKRAKSKPDVEGGKGDVLGKLSGDEAAGVLRVLLKNHPELRAEAEGIAVEGLREVSFLDVADEVESAVLQYDYDDLNSRAGAHSWGYTDPSEAAYELMQEAVEPIMDDLKRYLELGLEDQAREVCQGIVLGLYRVRDGGENDILGWAGDFPADGAGEALEAWRKADPAGRQLSRDFVEEHIPEWEWVLKASKRFG